MSEPRSLRRDLAVGVGGGVVALWFLAMLAAWFVLRQEMTEIYDAALVRTADRILQLPTTPGLLPSPTRGSAEDLSYMFRGPDGVVLARSPAADALVFGTAPQAGFRDHADHRIFGRELPDGTFLEVADPLLERRDATFDALVTLLIPAALLAPVIFFGVARFVGQRLRPVVGLTEQVAARDSADLRPLSAPNLQIELVPIQVAVNRLIGRLSDALAAERNFSANAAHELRTPIAATLAHTQRLIAEAPEGQLRARARTIERELRRMAQLSEKLLDLARAEGAGAGGGETGDLRAALTLVAQDFGTGAELHMTLPSTAVPAGIDTDAFAILARNLIENAITHGRPPVEVVLDGGGRLSVSNGGPELAPERLALLTRRFERLGSNRNGAGLGLAIVAALARNAGAQLDFRSPAIGRRDGLSVLVTFPPPQTSGGGTS